MIKLRKNIMSVRTIIIRVLSQEHVKLRDVQIEDLNNDYTIYKYKS